MCAGARIYVCVCDANGKQQFPLYVIPRFIRKSKRNLQALLGIVLIETIKKCASRGIGPQK